MPEILSFEDLVRGDGAPAGAAKPILSFDDLAGTEPGASRAISFDDIAPPVLPAEPAPTGPSYLERARSAIEPPGLKPEILVPRMKEGYQAGFGPETVGESMRKELGLPEGARPPATLRAVEAGARGLMGALSSAAAGVGSVYEQLTGDTAGARQIERDVNTEVTRRMGEAGGGEHVPAGRPGQSSPAEIQSFLGEAAARRSRTADDLVRTAAGGEPLALPAPEQAPRPSAPFAEPAPAAAAEPIPSAPPEAPIAPAAPAVSPLLDAERRLLKSYGYTDEQIAAMPRQQVDSALESRVEPPQAVAQPAPSEPPQTPSPANPEAPIGAITPGVNPAPATPPHPSGEHSVPGASTTTFQDLLSDPRSADEIRADLARQQAADQAAQAWAPSPDWQEVPSQRMADVGRDAALQVRTEGDKTLARIAPPAGSREAPVKVETPADVTTGAEQTAQPTPAQAEAGNYAKRHVKWEGLDISIETEAGMQRTGIGPDGKPWSATAPAPYGYLRKTKGPDGDHLDITLGPEPKAPQVFIVDQIDPSTLKFDEPKIFAGFPDDAGAIKTYDASFSDGSGPARMGGFTAMSVPEFKQWVENGNPDKPLSYKPPAAMKAKPGEAKGPLSLTQFLASKGGLKPDPGGELKSLGLNSRTRLVIPGLGYRGLIRGGGMTLDRARELAVENGYLNDPGRNSGSLSETTPNHLLDAIANELGGKKTFRQGDELAAAEIEAKHQRQAAETRLADAHDEVSAAAREHGLLASEAQVREAAELSLTSQHDPVDAIAHILERDALARRDEAGQSLPKERDHGEESLAETVGRGAVAAHEGPPPTRQQPAREGREEAPAPARRDQHGTDQRHGGEAQGVTERTAAGQQRVLPGAERVGQGVQAQRAAGKPLRPKVAQKSADHGLFSDDSKQTDLVDLAKAPPNVDLKVNKPTPQQLRQQKAAAQKSAPPSTKVPETQAEQYAYDKYLTKPGQQAANRAAVDALNSKITQNEALSKIAALLRSGEIGEGYARVQLNRLDLPEGKVRAAFEQPKAPETEPSDSRPLASIHSAKPVPGLYSAVLRAVENVKLPKAPPVQWLNTLRNIPGVKAEEVEWLGLDDWLKQQKGALTKEQVADYVRANQIHVSEVEKGGPSVDLNSKLKEAGFKAIWDDENGAFVGFDRISDGASFGDWDELPTDVRRVAREIQQGRPDEAPTKFGPDKAPNLTLPGGENYRELLLTLPSKPGRHLEIGKRLDAIQDEFDRLHNDNSPGAGLRRHDLAIEERKLRDQYADARSAEDRKKFNSSHWDEPNVLAHVRFNDRTIDGKRTLFLEEIQSDWHQAGKQKGYQPRDLTTLEARRREIERLGRDATPEQRQEWADIMNRLRPDDRDIEGASRFKGVPDAPFKTTWPELALKRMIRYAAENGYDQVAWTNGATQADRYDLSKQVDAIRAVKRPSDGAYALSARLKEHTAFTALNDGAAVPADKLSDYVGKDLADKIVKGGDGQQIYDGIDLKVGGQGMAGFYDKMLPAAANKLTKKFGGRVGESQVRHLDQTDRDVPFTVRDREGVVVETDIHDETHAMARAREIGGTYGFDETAGETRADRVHTLDITPQMRAAAMGEGFPLFKTKDGLGRQSPDLRGPDYLTPVARKRQRDLETMLRQMVAKMVGHAVKVQFSPGERLPSGESPGYGSASRGMQPKAMYMPAERLIKIALGHADPVSSAFHESWHDIEIHLLNDKQVELLKGETERLRPIVQERFGFTDQEAKDLAGYEVRAMAFEAYAGSREKGERLSGVRGQIGILFDRIRAFLRRIANALRGMGFKTTEDLFAKGFEGGFAKAPDRGARATSTLAAKRDVKTPETSATIAGHQVTAPQAFIDILLKARKEGAGPVAIGRMIEGHNKIRAMRAGAPAETGNIPANTGEIPSRIMAAAAKVQERNGAVMLADIHERLPDVPLAELHSALLQMQRDGKISLMRIDNNPAIKPRDRAAALKVGADERHLFMPLGPGQTLRRLGGEPLASILSQRPTTPAESAVLERVAPSEEKGNPLTFDKLYTAIKDDLNPIRLLRNELTEGATLPAEKDPYVLARLSRGSYGKAQQFLEHGTFDFDTLANTGKSLRDIIKPVKSDLDGLRAYSVSKRAIELEGRGIKTGVPIAEARQVVTVGSAKFEPVFQDLQAYQRSLADYLRASGILSDDGFAAMITANKDYVPFFRLMGDTELGRGLGGGLKTKDPVKGIRGSDRKIIDPIESIIKNTYLFVSLAERNRALTALADLADASPHGADLMPKVKPTVRPIEVTTAEIKRFLTDKGLDPDAADAMTIFRPNTFQPARDEIALFRGGKREVRKVAPEVAEAVNALDRQAMGLVSRILSIPARTLRAGAVLSPEFIARNPARDQWEAFINSNNGYRPVYDMLRGLGSILKRNDAYQRWLKSGAANSALVAIDRDYINQNVLKLENPTVLGRIDNVIMKPLEALRVLSELMENATRVGEFMRATEKGKSSAQAGYDAREITLDFARMGAQGRALNAIIAFWNAQVEGNDRLVRAFAKNPLRTLLKIAAAITLPSLLLWWANHDDDRVKELPHWQRDLFWIIATDKWAPYKVKDDGKWRDATDDDIGNKANRSYFRKRDGKWERNDGTLWRIPKPFAPGMIFGSIPERALDAYFDQTPKAFKDVGKTLKDALLPPVIPQAVSPILEQWGNQSFFRDRPIVPKYMEDVRAKFQATPMTTETAQLIGKAVAKINDETSFGSPMIIENYIRSWTGGLGMYALQGADKFLELNGITKPKVNPEKSLADIPVIRAFVARFPDAGAQSIQDFYEEWKRRKVNAGTVKFLAKSGQRDEAMEESAGHPLATAEKIHKALGTQSSLVRSIYRNPDIKPEEKRVLIDQVYVQMIELAKAGNGVFSATEKRGAPSPEP